MDSIFIKVPIEHKHRGQFRMCFTETGADVYGLCIYDEEKYRWECIDSYGASDVVTHTLKKVNVPTEEELHLHKEILCDNWMERALFSRAIKRVKDKLKRYGV